MTGALLETILERFLELGIVSAIAAIQACVVAVFFVGMHPRKIYDDATIVPMI